MSPCPATGKLPHRSLEDARKHARRHGGRANNGKPSCYWRDYCFGWHVELRAIGKQRRKSR